MICFLIGKNVILFLFLQQIYGIVQHDNNPKVIWLWQSVEGYTVRRFSALRIRKLCINKFIFGEINIYRSSITHSRHRHSAFPIVYPSGFECRLGGHFEVCKDFDSVCALVFSGYMYQQFPIPCRVERKSLMIFTDLWRVKSLTEQEGKHFTIYFPSKYLDI